MLANQENEIAVLRQELEEFKKNTRNTMGEILVLLKRMNTPHNNFPITPATISDLERQIEEL